MSKWGELVDGAITRLTWGELVGRVDSGAKWLVTCLGSCYAELQTRSRYQEVWPNVTL